jgi:preprotein translocase subunit SecE
VAKKGEADVTGKEVKDAKETKDSKVTKKAEEPKAGLNPSAFVEGVREELDKVVWPSRQQLISESLAVILMVTLSATIIYFVDNFFIWASQQVF